MVLAAAGIWSKRAPFFCDARTRDTARRAIAASHRRGPLSVDSNEPGPTFAPVGYTFVTATSGTTRPRSSSAKIANQIDLIVSKFILKVCEPWESSRSLARNYQLSRFVEHRSVPRSSFLPEMERKFRKYRWYSYWSIYSHIQPYRTSKDTTDIFRSCGKCDLVVSIWILRTKRVRSWCVLIGKRNPV